MRGSVVRAIKDNKGVQHVVYKGRGDNSLTPREIEVLILVSEGMTNKEIAEKLYVEVKTVGAHISHIYEKLNESNRVKVAIYALQNNLFAI